jgi:hypothetical protein
MRETEKLFIKNTGGKQYDGRNYFGRVRLLGHSTGCSFCGFYGAVAGKRVLILAAFRLLVSGAPSLNQ